MHLCGLSQLGTNTVSDVLGLKQEDVSGGYRKSFCSLLANPFGVLYSHKVKTKFAKISVFICDEEQNCGNKEITNN